MSGEQQQPSEKTEGWCAGWIWTVYTVATLVFTAVASAAIAVLM